jgi:hypothetical protein
MFKKTLIAIAILAISVPAVSHAKDMSSKYGLGYFNSNAPVGARYWFAKNAGVDLGLGFESVDLGSKKANNFYVEAGLPYVIFNKDKANFMIRPGLVYGSLDARPYGINSTKKWTKVNISLMPVAEIFLTDNFSLEAGHGLEVEMISYPTDAAFGALSGESRTNFRSLAASATQIGFHFYFK